MPINYTNRKGQTHVLCKGTTKTARPRYFFARQGPDAETLNAIFGHRVD